MLEFYENVKDFIKAALAVKSQHLNSNVKILELFVGISSRKLLCAAKFPDLCMLLLQERRKFAAN